MSVVAIKHGTVAKPKRPRRPKVVMSTVAIKRTARAELGYIGDWPNLKELSQGVAALRVAGVPERADVRLVKADDRPTLERFDLEPHWEKGHGPKCYTALPSAPYYSETRRCEHEYIHAPFLAVLRAQWDLDEQD